MNRQSHVRVGVDPQGASVEPQDAALNTRHLVQTATQVTLSDKPLYIFACGGEQTRESFEMMGLARPRRDDASLRLRFFHNV